jgi:hypothetical protein
LEKPQFKICKNRLKLVLENKNYKTANRKDYLAEKKKAYLPARPISPAQESAQPNLPIWEYIAEGVVVSYLAPSSSVAPGMSSIPVDAPDEGRRPPAPIK